MSTDGTPRRPTVTLFESFGSGARTLGPALADALGVSWIDQAYSSAHLSRAQDAADNPDHFLRDIFSLLSRTNSGPDNSIPYVHADGRISHDNGDEVRRLVANGGVILGRNATVILAGVPGTLHVKLDAPASVRIERIARLQGVSPEAARAQVEREDAARLEMSRRLYDWDPRRTHHYDLVLNTAVFEPDACLRLILAAWDASGRAER